MAGRVAATWRSLPMRDYPPWGGPAPPNHPWLHPLRSELLTHDLRLFPGGDSLDSQPDVFRVVDKI